MAGNLYAVRGSSRFNATASCPTQLQGVSVKLKSSDGETLEVDGVAACISGMICQIAVAGKLEEGLKLPIKKATLSKVVEHMNHHKDMPAGDIITPLPSDSLGDCGVLKWDATFIAVDKEMLIELIVAASPGALDIPSLLFLASAKAALLVKGKPADKIRKDFALSADVSADDEEELNNKWVETRWKCQQGMPDESGVFGTSAILAAICACAEKNGVLTAERSEEPDKPAGNHKSARLTAWRSIVLMDWQQIINAPVEVQGERDLMFAAITASSGLAFTMATSELRKDKTLVLHAVKLNGDMLKEADAGLRSDPEFVKEAVMMNGTAMVGATDELCNDRAFILDCAKRGKGSAMKGASRQLQADSAFVLQCVAPDPEAFKYAAPPLQDARDFALQAVATNGKALQYMQPMFKADREIVAAAVKQDETAVVFAHTSRRVELGAQDAEVELKDQKQLQDAAGIGAGQLVEAGSRHMAVSLEMETPTDTSYMLRVQKMVQFSALSTMTANMGQANYIASNSWLDKIQFYERPEVDAVTLMWGAVGNIGMRWKAFASADFLNANPEALLSIADASKILNLTTVKMDPPEWYAGSFFDEYSRGGFLAPTAGGGTGGGWRPSETQGALVPSRKPEVSIAAGGTADVERQNASIEHSTAPLRGWPTLLDVAQEQSTSVMQQFASDAAKFTEGARVELIGIQNKEGSRGSLVRQCKDGKWKVRLDGEKGNALLRAHYLRLVAATA